MARLGWIAVAVALGAVLVAGQDGTTGFTTIMEVADFDDMPPGEAVAKSFMFQIQAEMGETGGDPNEECYGLGDLHNGHCDCLGDNLATVLESCKTSEDAEDAFIMSQEASEMCGDGELHETHCDCNSGLKPIEIPTCVYEGTVVWEDISVDEVEGEERQMNVTFVVPSDRAEAVEEALKHGFESGEMSEWLDQDVSLVSMSAEAGVEPVKCDQTCLNWKIGFLFIIFAETILGGALPFLLSRFDGKKVTTATDFMLFFSGGILLSTSLIHILPHALEDLLPIERRDWQEYPYAMTMFMVGFLIDYGVDQLGDHMIARAERKRDAGMEKLAADHKLAELDEDTNGLAPATNGTANEEEADQEAGGKLIDSPETHLTKEEEAAAERLRMRFIIASITVYGGLSVHAVFAGIALGIGDFNAALAMFIAIMSHKIFAAFAAASNLIKSGCPMWLYWLAILLFACVTPTGIAIGIGVSEVTPPLVSGTLEALSAGMLLYVGTIHTLGDVSEDTSIGPLLAYFGYIVGVSIMVIVTAVLAFTGVHSAGHGH